MNAAEEFFKETAHEMREDGAYVSTRRTHMAPILATRKRSQSVSAFFDGRLL